MKFMLLALVLNAGVFAAPADPPQAQQTASQRQALGDLAQRAQGEIDKIHGQMRDQVKAVQHKYRQLRYQVIGENQPGATALLQQMDDVRDKKKRRPASFEHAGACRAAGLAEAREIQGQKSH